MATTTTTRIEVIPKKITVINKAQFGETSIPGSQFVTSQLKESSAARNRFSVGRLMLMGLVGGGIGYGVGSIGKGKKGHKWRDAAIGGAVGAVGSILLPPFGAEDVDVSGAMVMPDGKASIVFVGPKTGSLRAKKDGRMHAVPMLITSKQTELPGWAGAILAHGMMVQRAQMHYVWDRSKYWDVFQVAPDYGFYQDDKAAPDHPLAWPGGVHSQLPSNFHNKTLWTERFAEWPCPAWPRFGINWVHPCEYDQAGWAGHGTCTSPIQQVTAENLHARLANLMKAMAFSHSNITDPTRRAVNQGLSQATMKYAMPMVGGAYYKNTVPMVDKFWNSNKTRFNKKYDLLMRRSQWFVWAAEMFRIHAGVMVEALPGWSSHCAQWGVGCANTVRIAQKKTMLTYHSSSWMTDSTGKAVSADKNPIAVKLTVPAVQEYIKLVMEQTPAPFTTDPKKQLMVPPTGVTRWMLDMPDVALGDSSSLGSVLPPLDTIDQGYFQYLCERFATHSIPQWAKIGQIIFAAVISVVGTYVGGPLGAGVGGTMFAFACTVFVTILRMSSGNGKFDAGDIAKAVGNLLSQILDESGIEFDEMFGDEMGDLLKNLETAAYDSGFADSINSVLSSLESLKKDLNWPYVDEVFGTILDNEYLSGQDVEGAISAVSHL
jgi:hypothetical protein